MQRCHVSLLSVLLGLSAGCEQATSSPLATSGGQVARAAPSNADLAPPGASSTSNPAAATPRRSIDWRRQRVASRLGRAPYRKPAPNEYQRVVGTRSRLTGGRLMVDRDGRGAGVEFEMEVWNGAYVGGAKGTANRRGRGYVWRIADLPRCTLTLTPVGRSWRLAQNGDWLACAQSARTTLSGQYVPAVEAIRPSFDCNATSSEVDRVICTDEVLARLDREVASATKALRRGASHSSWHAARDECTPGPPLLDDDARWEAAVRCLIARHVERLRALGRLSEPDLSDYLAQTAVAARLRAMLGPDYYRLVDYSSERIATRDAGYIVVRGAPTGMRFELEGFLADGEHDTWAALLTPHERDDGTYEQRIDRWGPTGSDPPAPYETWRARFSKPAREVHHAAKRFP